MNKTITQGDQAGVPASSTTGLILAAAGVVFGDIGTSPLYAFKESFHATGMAEPDIAHIYGILSLIFWSVTWVVSIKYAVIVMRADNKGEGGELALLALVSQVMRGQRAQLILSLIGIFAAALFFGDSMITPAISVLSAVEGLEVALPSFESYVEPVTIIIVILLFSAQSRGTSFMGFLFGPIICVWFAALAVIGIYNIVQHPEILQAINPIYAIRFFIQDGWQAFIVLGSVFLAMTGAEALYLDIGHFGKAPIRIAWFCFVMPALMLNYFGQGALIIANPAAIEHPFFLSFPEWALIPMVILATMATIIASQAVITGAFSMARQAIQLGVLPRLRIIHTSESEKGQIYIPFINWLLMIFVCLLVLGFKSSSNLASAYGIAVTGTMLTTSILISAVFLKLWKWRKRYALPLIVFMLTIDIAFLAANSTKLLHGGWFPLVIAVGVFVLLTTWKRGRQLMAARIDEDTLPIDIFHKSLSDRVHRVRGTAIFLTGRTSGVPHSLLHNLKHNKIVHERNIFVTVQIEDVAHIPIAEQVEVTNLVNGFFRIIISYGFMDDIDVPKSLLRGTNFTPPLNLQDSSFFISRETIIPGVRPGMSLWRELLFSWMSRNAANAMEFFNLPTNRVVELGTQIEI